MYVAAAGFHSRKPGAPHFRKVEYQCLRMIQSVKERGQSGLAQQHGVVGRAEKAQVGRSFENSFWEVKPQNGT